MTLAELLKSFGDKSTDPFLSDPVPAGGLVPAVNADPFGGAPHPGPSVYDYQPVTGGAATGEEAFGDDRPLDPLSLDSVFFDNTPEAPLQETPDTDLSGLPGLPEWPVPGVQFATVVGGGRMGELNASLEQGWRVRHAVPVGSSADVLVVLEFGTRVLGTTEASSHEVLRPDARPPHRGAVASAAPPTTEPPAPGGAPQPPAWVATPADRPQSPPDWTSGL